MKSDPLFNQPQDWEVEPSESAIRAEMSRTGGSYEQCRTRLSAEMAKDAALLRASAPDAFEDVRRAVTAATEAQQRADEILEAQRGALDELRGSISHLALLRRQIKALSRLVVDKARESEIAATALDFYVEAHTGGASARTESGWTSNLDDLAKLIAIRPHVKTRIEALEARAAEVATGIRAKAEREKINLGAVVRSMADAALDAAAGLI